MTDPTPISLVPKPKAGVKIQFEIEAHLTRMLKLNAEGALECIFIIAAHPDGTYSEAISSTTQFRQMVGQVEVVKQNWIGQYLAGLGQQPQGKG